MFIFVLVKGKAPFTPNKAADFSAPYQNPSRQNHINQNPSNQNPINQNPSNQNPINQNITLQCQSC